MERYNYAWFRNFPLQMTYTYCRREESTDTLGANFIRSKGRYFFTAVLLFRARFYNLLWPTQICILKRDSHCSGENFTKQRVNKRHLDRFDGEVRSVITPVKSIRIKTP